MYGKGYVWFWNNIYRLDGWMQNDFISNCSTENVLSAADGYFSLHYATRSLSNNVAVSKFQDIYIQDQNGY